MNDYGTEIVTVGRALPKLASVEPGNGRYDVQVTWAAGARVGRTDTVDLAPMIFTFKVFKALRDGAVAFDTVRLGDYGASIVWPENEDLDIGADAIEEMAEQAMTNEDFSAFLKRNKLTFDAAAAHLGIARRLVAYYAKEREIPRYIALACQQLDLLLGNSDELQSAIGVESRVEVRDLSEAPVIIGSDSSHHFVPRDLVPLRHNLYEWPTSTEGCGHKFLLSRILSEEVSKVALGRMSNRPLHGTVPGIKIGDKVFISTMRETIK
jgi:hypothetical protein